MCVHTLCNCVHVYAGMFARVGAHVEARSCLQDVFLHTSARYFCESVALTEPSYFTPCFHPHSLAYTSRPDLYRVLGVRIQALRLIQQILCLLGPEYYTLMILPIDLILKNGADPYQFPFFF